MDLVKFKSEYPDITQALLAEGAAAERARIQAVEAQFLPGHEALVQQLKFDGMTTGPEAAAKIVEAERQSRKVALDQIRSDAPAAVPTPPAPVPTPEAGADVKREQLIKAKMDEKKIDMSAAILEVAKEHPELFKDRK